METVKHDPTKQKVRPCKVCNTPVVTDKFGTNHPTCAACEERVTTVPVIKRIEQPQITTKTVTDNPFMTKLAETAKKHGFTLHEGRWRRKISLPDGGVATCHIMVDPARGDVPARLSYFSYVTQRVIDVAEEFQRFMPADLAADCEMVTADLADAYEVKPQIGYQKCNRCGQLTDQFGVDDKRAKIYCIEPNGCFKLVMSTGGAESLE